jgi:tetratricopeptide (TPR) repeat protein
MSDVSDYLRILAEAQLHTSEARWPAAAALWAQVTERNPVNGSHWARLAEARYELGDYRGALTAYQKAADNGVWAGGDDIDTVFPAEIAYRMASCHVRLGDHESAVRELGRALRLGFRDLDRPRQDEHWEPLRAEAAVREMLGIIDTDAMTRDQGWRADLAFFAREVKRRAYAPFAEVAEPDFDAAVGQLSAEMPDLTDFQIVARMMRLLRPLGDGHAFVIPAEDSQDAQLSLPVKFYRFTEGLFVTAAAAEYKNLLGAQVLMIGEHPVEEALAAVDPLLSRDNSQQVTWLGPEVLRWTPLMHALGLIPGPGEAELTVRLPGGATDTVTVTSVVAGPHDYPTVAPAPRPTQPRPAGWISLPDTLAASMPMYLRNCDVRYWFDYLPDEGLVYFQFNGVGDQPPEKLAEFCERLFAFIEGHEVSKLVIDLRWNGGGNTYLVQPLLHRLIGCTKINQLGCLFVIIGRGTFSAAQNTATAIERETNAIFVGEPSGSRPNFIGETIPFTLPYSKAMVNVADLYWQTSWPMDHRPWIAPQLYAPPAFELYSQNRDPAMEAILACHEHLPGC